MATIETVSDVTPAGLSRFDAIIDVRSPAEFEEDHVPGAISLPVLSNEERAVVGTIYVQESPFKARKIGGAIVARNVAHHLDTALADKDGAFQPLVYCWRGGQRSGAMATILANVGWRTAVLKGGYKTYRRWVQSRLYEQALPHTLVVLEGGAGVGKTALLGLLRERGVQTIDLEGLAGHRGSLFGAIPGREQPSQKMFESRLLGELDLLDPERPTVVEAESSKIGELMNPPSLWKSMTPAPRIEPTAPREARARYLVRVYQDVIEDRAVLDWAFERLPVHHGKKVIEDWTALADAGAYETLAAQLLEQHYDPAYARANRKVERVRMATIELPDLTPADLARCADVIVEELRRKFPRA